MTEMIQLGEIAIAVTRKDVKLVHLSVHPPAGRVSLVAPTGTRLEVARAYAVSKLGWIRAQQAKLRHIGAKLKIEPGMTVLDIGSGWGQLAIYLAKACDIQIAAQAAS